MPPSRPAGNGKVHMLGTVSVILQSLHTQHTAHSFAFAVDTNLLRFMRKKHVLTDWNSKKNTPRKIVTRMLCTLSSVGSLLLWIVTVNRGADEILLWKEASF